MIDIFKEYSLEDIIWDEKNLKILSHSKTVATAAELIASKTEFINSEKAYTYGLMHDIAKFYLSKKEKHRHPRIGYEMLRDNHPDIAEICLTHPFPDESLPEYILHYCHEDAEEAKKIEEYLKNIKENDYMKLIQYCDKICGQDEYITLDYKFNWYGDNYNIDKSILNKRLKKYKSIKKYFDELSGIDTYTLFNFSKTMPEETHENIL